jgi:long-chain-fatty-acid--[acyl-carrier-protein] ligase
VSCNRPEAIHEGTIGQALPGVEVIVVDIETMAKLPTGQMGMILVHGPNIFHGYVGTEHAPPFHEVEGKKYYVTGDLAVIDAEGIITFSGRLKRFLKAGGEMISLPALEEPFVQKFPPTEDGPRVAVEGVENEHGRKIVLFTTVTISVREANALLVEKGFHGVMRLDDVVKVDALPVLGTGKTDYKVLRKRIEGMIGG